MKMLRCRKCGTAVISDETLIQYVLDGYNEAVQNAARAKGSQKSAALAEVAEYRSIYKALMHNISSKDYAEAVTPYILNALVDTIKSRNLLTEDELAACYDKGKQTAQARKESLEKEVRRIYGEAQRISASPPYRDPTANEAITNVDKGGGE